MMRRRPAGLLAVAIVLAAAAALAAWGWQRQQAGEQQRARGAALFHGELPLVGRLPGHTQALPVTALRCSNCHEAPQASPVSLAPLAGPGGTVATARPFAGRLTGAALSTPRPRRGGPPSSYDAQRLCELLRSGVDPAQVMIPNTMPRYDLTPAGCADLWAYLLHESD